MSVKVKNKPEYKILRSYFRRNMPAPEVMVWQMIRNNSLGVKFRRQFSIDNYILDFYSPVAKIAIEIDGESHFRSKIAKGKDELRDRSLKTRFGIKVLRFTNLEVMENLDGVITGIIENLPPS